MSGKLYIVPTPVGNLDDMTVRAINTLRDADCILAEDTRTSSVLMKHFGITTRMQSHHKFNEHDTLPALRQYPTPVSCCRENVAGTASRWSACPELRLSSRQ